VDDLTWLLVLSGNWGYADSDRQMRSFPAGLYLDVDEETQDFVRRASSPQLVLGEGEPPDYSVVIAPPGVPGAVTHLRVSQNSRIVLAQPEVIEEIADEQGDDRPLTFPCPRCDAQFPHQAPLRRHVQRSHAEPANDQAADRPPDPEPERALTDA
jgi:hypothetical protein